MQWSSLEEENSQAQKASNKVHWVTIPLGVIVFGLLGFFIQQNNTQQEAHFVAQRLSCVVADKYIRDAGRPTLTLVLRDAQQEFISSPSVKNYELLQRGDSLYKPAGSAMFYVHRDSSDHRIWKMLPDALHY